MKDIDLNNLKEDFSRIFGMMAGSTHPTTGRMVLAEKEMLRLLEFVTQTPVLIEQLESAQRDIGKLEDEKEGLSAALDNETLIARRAEAELKRRDTQEPVAWRVTYDGGSSELCKTKQDAARWHWELDDNGYLDVKTQQLYAAAPAAVLLPELTPADAECSLSAEQAGAWVSGANWMRDKAIEMGCQPEKVVKLPPAEKDGGTDWQGDIIAGCVNRMRGKCIEVLEAAGVKWVEGE